MTKRHIEANGSIGGREYDRYITLNAGKELDYFVQDPEACLRNLGALDSLPAFNGIVNFREPGGLEKFKDACSALPSLGTQTCFHIVGPVPDFCMWECFPTAPDID